MADRLASVDPLAIGVTGDIVAGKRAITADTDLRLCRYFGLTDGYWLRGQARYDTERARDALEEVLDRIEPLAQKAA